MSTAMPPENDPGFDLYADQRGRIIGTMVTLFIISTISVALRFASRKFSRAGVWLDDYLSLAALLFSLMCPALSLYELRAGFGRHIYIYSPTEQVTKATAWLKDFYVFELIFHTSTTFSKLAILAFYYRIFPIPGFRRLLIWIGGLCLLYMVAVDLAVIFQCHPIHYAWDQVQPNAKGHCFNQDNFILGSGSINVVLNFLIFILPISLLRRLRTTARQRIVLGAIFTLAGFIVLVSIIWVIVLSKIERADVTWNYINAGIWTSVEPNMAVVCACIPSLRPLFSVINRGFSHAPLVRNLSHSTSSGPFQFIRGSKSRPSNGTSSHWEESDDLRPLGLDVDIRGGKINTGQTDEEAVELPQKGIAVKTEMTLTTSERLEYNDRLF